MKTDNHNSPPSWWRPLKERNGLGGKELWLVFLYVAAIIACRGTDRLTNAQFYAEGGTWYEQAYNAGWVHSLFLPVSGYYAIAPKLIVGLSLLVPMLYAPLFTNICGVLVQAMPVPLLLSARSSTWGTLPMRLAMAAVYVALPNAEEVHVVLPNMQWHLALGAILLLLANPPASWQWKMFDSIVYLLCGLTGPFCLILLPVAAIVWWKGRRPWNGIVCGLFLCTVAVEGASLLCGGLEGRGKVSLGATPVLLAKMLAGQVFLGSLIGENEVFSRASLPTILLVFFIGMTILVWVFLKAGWEWRLFLLFCAMLTVAELMSPLSKGTRPWWMIIGRTSGSRYWFFPMLAFAWSLLWCATNCSFKPGKVLALAGIVAMLWTAGREWKYLPFDDGKFASSVAKLASAPEGTLVKIPICPRGWAIELKKGQHS
jgi:hypothetical protein